MDEFDQIQIEELQKDIEVLQARFIKIGEEIRDGVDPEQEVKFNNRKKKIKAEIQSKKAEIQTLKQNSQSQSNSQNQSDALINTDCNLLKNKLMTLNYISQNDVFRDFWNSEKNHQIGSFIIQGEVNSCPRWLVNRLVNKYISDANYKIRIELNLDDNKEKSIEHIWDILAKSSTIKTIASPEKIVDRIYQNWQNGTVVLVFYNLDKMYKTEPKKLIDQFWFPLVEKIQNHSKKCNFRLAMFLVNPLTYSDVWNIDFFQNTHIKKVYHPIILEPISNFSQHIIRQWMINNRNILSGLLPDINSIDGVTNNIWNSSYQGVPKLVMERLCNRCNTSFYEINKSLSI